jgi:alpha-beta hydrolase superfamily lysophospholipase
MTTGRAVCIAAFAVAAMFVLLVVATEATLHPTRRALRTADRQRVEEMARAYHAELSDVQITAADGITLRAWSLRPVASGSGAGPGTIVAFHGVTDNRLSMVGYAEIFLRHGYAVLLPDARAHGVSGGDTATYGLREADDIHRWVDWLEANERPGCVYGFAESMGAAGLLQSLNGETRFCAVVAESPFSSFREVEYDRIGQFFHTGPWLAESILRPVVDGTFLYANWKYGLDFSLVSAERAVASTQVPVLLIHGIADHNVPIRHSRAIAASNGAVELWEVPGADHCGAMGVAPEAFERRAVGWFAGHGSTTNLQSGPL